MEWNNNGEAFCSDLARTSRKGLHISKRCLYGASAALPLRSMEAYMRSTIDIRRAA